VPDRLPPAQDEVPLAKRGTSLRARFVSGDTDQTVLLADGSLDERTSPVLRVS
jgi:hypothetical protein